MSPFVRDLPGRDAYLADFARAAGLAAVKIITTPRCLGMNFGEIRIDGGAGRCMSAEAFELRVVPISPCAPAQHGLRKQRLTPQGNQALRIEVTGVEGPETQAQASPWKPSSRNTRRSGSYLTLKKHVPPSITTRNLSFTYSGGSMQKALTKTNRRPSMDCP